MTRGTHQVGAFAAAVGTLLLARPLLAGEATPGWPAAVGALSLALPGGTMPWWAATVYLLAALLGGVAPDLDKPRRLWARLLADRALGGHRHLSHSLLGLAGAAALTAALLSALSPWLPLPGGLPWLGFVTGYASHLILDTLTIEGVPWLFPWPRFVGLPPLAELRVRTGGLVEELVVVPGLLIVVGWLGYVGGTSLASLWR